MIISTVLIDDVLHESAPYLERRPEAFARALRMSLRPALNAVVRAHARPHTLPHVIARARRRVAWSKTARRAFDLFISRMED